MHKPSPPETISLELLAAIAASSSGKIKHAARDALAIANRLNEANALGSILLDRHLRTIQVYRA